MINVRRIAATEIHLVAALFNSYRVFYKQTSDLSAATNFLQARLDNNESVIYVAFEESDKIVPIGFTQLYPIYSSVRMVKNWILNDLFVESNYRKQGIGEKLIRAALDFAKDNNAKYVQLETATDNFIAQSLYEQIGFALVPPETEYLLYQINLT